MIKPLLIAAATTVGMSTAASADVPGKDWIGVAKVKAMLSQEGYRITKIEADDGHWEGEATRRNVRYEFHVDPHSGKITKMERDRD